MADRTKQGYTNKPFDFTLIITVVLLLAFGIIMLLSASSPVALSEGVGSYYYVIRQGVFTILGIVAMFIISHIDYKIYKRFYKLAYLISVLLLAAVLIIGKEVNNAQRWIDFGFTTFQPSEAVKVLLIGFYAGILTQNADKLQEFKRGFLYHIAFVLPIAGLLILEPHLSATIIITVTSAIMLLVAGGKVKHFALTGLTMGVPALGAIIAFFPYQLQRVKTFLDPFADKQGDGWQVVQSLYAIGSGGLFGVGLRKE